MIFYHASQQPIRRNGGNGGNLRLEAVLAFATGQVADAVGVRGAPGSRMNGENGGGYSMMSWSTLIYSDLWLFTVIYSALQRYIVIYSYSQWFTVIYSDL